MPSPHGLSTTELLLLVRANFAQAAQLQADLIERLLAEGHQVPPDIGEIFEDAGNLYLGLSEAISARVAGPVGI